MMERDMTYVQTIVGYAMAGILFMTMTACSSDQPKPLAQPTPDQVRGHADRAFEKLKQEEQERAGQPPMPR
jgi:orotate phosphoribosyltransferase